jgi:L-amino acid N-acyltransferase YncA
VTGDMNVREARAGDLEAVVAIYNQTIPGRMATADLEPVTVAQRQEWWADHSPDRRPLWVAEAPGGAVAGWLSFGDFYGRPAYHATVEVGVYVDAGFHRRGVGRTLVAHALERAPGLGLRTLLAFTFGHNTPSLALFAAHGFAPWGRLPGVAELDGVRRDLVLLGREVSV